MGDWREELVEILSRVDKYEKLGGLRELATFVRNSLLSDRDFLDSITIDLRWYYENADVRVRFIDTHFQIEIDLGYLSIKQDMSLTDFKQKLLEKKLEFLTKAIAMLFSELEDALYRAQQEKDDP